MNKRIFVLLLLMHNYAMADITINSFKETYSENIEVSGEYLVGIQLNANNNSKSLHVYFPKGSKGNLCIKLSSIDGKYKATINHKITNPISELTKINFTSHYKDILDNYSNKEIAISASFRDPSSKLVGSDKSCDNFKRLVSSWGGDATDDLVLLIRSSARKDVAYIKNGKTQKIKSKCHKFRKTYNVTYDKYCVLKGVDWKKTKEIDIVRKNLQPIKPETIRIN